MNYDRIDIALGQSPIKPVYKYGRGYVDSATDCDIWDRADSSATQNVWTAPTTARKHNVKSSDVADVSESSTLTLAANVHDGDTVTIGSKRYTFQTTLTDVDGNVKIGVDASASIDNLIAAINLAAGGGSTYAASMTANSIGTVASAGAGDTMVLWVQSTSYVATTSTTSATGTLTLSANVSNLDTVTIGSKVYTFVDTLTNVDGYVKIGATASISIDNLISAINLTAGGGTAYAASTTANPISVVASAGTGDTMDLVVANAGAIATTSAVVKTTGVLTLAANVHNGDTVTIGSKRYTFQTTLTDVDGNVKIGVSASASIDNLIAAINLGTGAGTVYAASMTANTFDVVASAGAGDTMDISVTSAGTKATTSTTTATGTLTLATNVEDGDTVTIGSMTYTFVDVLTQSMGDVLIGTTASASIDNLIAAIMNTEGSRGTLYSITAQAHPNNVVASAGAGDTMDLVVPLGTEIATTEDSTHMSWGHAHAQMGTPDATWGASTTSAITKVATWGAAATVPGTPDATWGASVSALGTGARKVRLYGLTAWDEEETYEDVYMHGTSDVSTVNSYVIIHHAEVLEFGSDGPNKGTLTFTAQTDATVTAQIGATAGITRMAILGVPEGKELLLNDINFSAIKAALGVLVSIKLLVAIDPENLPAKFIEKAQYGLVSDGSNVERPVFDLPLRISGPAIVKLQGNASANDIIITAGYNGELHDSI